MNNIIECKLESTYKEIFTGLWQYDYGQILRITGVEFPKAVEIQFSLNEKSGSTITRIGTTVDGATEVQIPNELLKNDGRTYDYCIYAYIYLTDETSGSTEYEIVLRVKSRTKPENPSEEPLPEPNIFHETVAAVNASAERAEKAASDAENIRDNLNLDLSEKITRPDTAKVGQVLAVKEIDESGKPTVFEAEDVKIPTKTSELENDSGFLTEHQDISGKLDKEKLPEAIDDALAQAKESGEFNGKDGAPGEKGEPGETTYIENPYDDTEIKKKIAVKVGYSEVVGNQLLMYADDTKEKLLATLELPSGVEDVQINGTSIVENGIAEIPLCATSKAPGLITIDTYSNSGGLYRANNDTGLIRIAKASDNSLAERKNEFCPVVPRNLDYAVKSAMCDGKGVAWKAEEQAAARERMGVIQEDDFELITTVNPSKEEIVSSISIELAEPIKANFYIVCDIGIIDGSLNYVNIPKLEFAINNYYTWMYQPLQKSSKEVRYMLMQIPICKKSGLVILSNSIPINNDFQSSTNISGNGLGIAPYSDRNYSRGITKINIGAKNNFSGGYFSKNTVFAIYGKRI